METRELTDTDVLRWLLSKMQCHRGYQGSEIGWWTLPVDTLTREAPTAMDAILDQIEQEKSRSEAYLSKMSQRK